jgi:hypothetical protein
MLQYYAIKHFQNILDCSTQLKINNMGSKIKHTEAQLSHLPQMLSISHDFIYNTVF